ncbi:MAG: PP2C family protein-serine/threonine phosphatase [Wenzhouxiangella sp.]
MTPTPQMQRSAGASETGCVRANNQDAILADDDLGLWLVVDGMGGHAGGARASEIALDTIREHRRAGSDLRDAVLHAHHAIRSEQASRPEYNDMGTTVVAAVENDAAFEICWVGDSRAYRFSPKTGQLELLTRDHNVAGMLVAAGALSPSEAARHPQRHVLTDCLGLTGEHEPRIGTLQDRWRPGDWLLLCSDGLTGELDDAEIEQTLASAGDLAAAQSALLERALAAGAHDNVSIVMLAAPQIENNDGNGRSRWPWPFGRRPL